MSRIVSFAGFLGDFLNKNGWNRERLGTFLRMLDDIASASGLGVGSSPTQPGTGVVGVGVGGSGGNPGGGTAPAPAGQPTSLAGAVTTTGEIIVQTSMTFAEGRFVNYAAQTIRYADAGLGIEATHIVNRNEGGYTYVLPWSAAHLVVRAPGTGNDSSGGVWLHVQGMVTLNQGDISDLAFGQGVNGIVIQQPLGTALGLTPGGAGALVVATVQMGVATTLQQPE